MSHIPYELAPIILKNFTIDFNLYIIYTVYIFNLYMKQLNHFKGFQLHLANNLKHL